MKFGEQKKIKNKGKVFGQVKAIIKSASAHTDLKVIKAGYDYTSTYRHYGSGSPNYSFLV